MWSKYFSKKEPPALPTLVVWKSGVVCVSVKLAGRCLPATVVRHDDFVPILRFAEGRTARDSGSPTGNLAVLDRHLIAGTIKVTTRHMSCRGTFCATTAILFASDVYILLHNNSPSGGDTV